MRLSMYWNYATRSLIRGGKRTVLAVFCIAVGVMAIVALQLSGVALASALAGNARATNGGDLAIDASLVPLTATQLTTFDQLRTQGQIRDYGAFSQHLAVVLGPDGARNDEANLLAITPQHFLLDTQPVFVAPSNATLDQLVQGHQVVVSPDILPNNVAKVGMVLTVTSDDGRSVQATVAGIIRQTAPLNGQPFILMDEAAYAALPTPAPNPVKFSTVFIDVPGHDAASTNQLRDRLKQQFPLAQYTTEQEAAKANADQTNVLTLFLKIAGLLALLIGGVGISNTILVLLRRRVVEIAMLKTAGYRRRDLYSLFGLEALLLGLMGGIIGAAAGVGISFLVSGLLAQTFTVYVPTPLDPLIIGSGVVIGAATSLVFGLLPIARASQVRPLAVLRNLPEGNRWASAGTSLLLLVLQLALLIGLAWSILHNIIAAAATVVGAVLLILMLGGGLAGIVWLVSRVPLGDRVHWWSWMLGGLLLLLSLALTAATPAYGAIVLALVAGWFALRFTSARTRAQVQSAFRNFGRQRIRSVTTLLALIAGIFAIGLVVVVGQYLQIQIDQFVSGSDQITAVVQVPTPDRVAVDQQLAQMAGLRHQEALPIFKNVPSAINGVALSTQIQALSPASQTEALNVLYLLNQVQGFDLAGGQRLPSGFTAVLGSQDHQVGTMLGPADAGTQHMIVDARLSEAPLKLKLGDQMTYSDSATKSSTTFTITGFYHRSGATLIFGGAYADARAVLTAGGSQTHYIYYLGIDPGKSAAALQQLQHAVPDAQALSVASLVNTLRQLFQNVALALVAVASFALLAGIVSIANTVALAMLERRREIGILKSIGHTSGNVLGVVLLENGLLGLLGGFLAMVLVALVAYPLSGAFTFGSGNSNASTFSIAPPQVLLALGLAVLTCLVVALGVAWSATRVRPIEVLRYE